MVSQEFRDRLQTLVHAIYECPGGGCGCCLHIVLDDTNLEDSHIQWCLDNSIKHGICREVAEMLLSIPVEDREEILNW